MKRILYRVFPLFAVALTFLLSGCGSQDKNHSEIDSHIYVAETIEQNNDWITRRNFTVTENYLYYMENLYTIKRAPLSELDNGIGLIDGEIVLTASNVRSAISQDGGNAKDFSEADIRDYAVDFDENIYCILAVEDNNSISAILNGTYTPNEKNNTADASGKKSARGLLYKCSSSGETAYWLELPELRVLYGNPDWLAVDNRGNAYLLTAEAILAVDMSGKITGRLPVELADNIDVQKGVNGRLLEGKNGQVYYVAEPLGVGTSEIFLISDNGGLQMTPVSLPSIRWQKGIYEGTEGLLKSSRESLFQYVEEENSLLEVLKWEDSGLAGNDVMGVVQIDADHYLVTVHASGSFSNLMLTKTSRNEIPEKEIIVIASLSPGDTLRRSVAEFNHTNDKYHVILETYDAGGGDENEMLMRLNNRLMAKDPPDLLDLSGLDVSKYADIGMLEDLNPYIDAEGIINKANYPANLLEGYTINGKLACIPRGFAFYAVFGVTPESHTIESWTIPELMSLTESYPEKKLFPGGTEYLLKEFCAPYYLKQFIDWKKGTCRFDSEEFCALLDWVKTQNQEGRQSQDTLFLFSFVRYFDEYLHTLLHYGDDTVMYGYPSADGNTLYIPYVLDALSILSSSGNKEGAWAFLRCFLAEEIHRDLWFPARQDMLEEAYLNAVTASSSPKILYPTDPDIAPIEYYAMEPQQADIVKQALESIDFTPRSSAENSIVNIIWEESQYFFSGSKTSEEAARTIQNRAQLVLQERTGQPRPQVHVGF